MPVPLGNFLSTKMYGGRLQSKHDILAMSACKLVDVPEGKEELGGKSWKVTYVPAASTRADLLRDLEREGSRRRHPHR